MITNNPRGAIEGISTFGCWQSEYFARVACVCAIARSIVDKTNELSITATEEALRLTSSLSVVLLMADDFEILWWITIRTLDVICYENEKQYLDIRAIHVVHTKMEPVYTHGSHCHTISKGHVDGIPQKDGVVRKLSQLEASHGDVCVVRAVIVDNATADLESIVVGDTTVDTPSELYGRWRALGCLGKEGSHIDCVHICWRYVSNNASVVVDQITGEHHARNQPVVALIQVDVGDACWSRVVRIAKRDGVGKVESNEE